MPVSILPVMAMVTAPAALAVRTASTVSGVAFREQMTARQRLSAELGPAPFAPRESARTTARVLPLGVLFHIAAGNMPGLPVYTVLEGLLTGNINLVKLPHGDKGLSLAAFGLLAEQEPRLSPYIYAFDLPSGQREDMKALAAMADGLVVWGGDGAIKSARTLAGPGCKLMEWGHRLSFAYVSGYADKEAELSALVERVDYGRVSLDGDRLIFHCAKSGHKLDALRREAKASFCVIVQDQIVPEEYTTHFRSVIAFGRVRELTDEAERRTAALALARKYHPGDSEEHRQSYLDRSWASLCLLELRVEHLTGKQARELAEASS